MFSLYQSSSTLFRLSPFLCGILKRPTSGLRQGICGKILRNTRFGTNRGRLPEQFFWKFICMAAGLCTFARKRAGQSGMNSKRVMKDTRWRTQIRGIPHLLLVLLSAVYQQDKHNIKCYIINNIYYDVCWIRYSLGMFRFLPNMVYLEVFANWDWRNGVRSGIQTG